MDLMGEQRQRERRDVSCIQFDLFKRPIQVLKRVHSYFIAYGCGRRIEFSVAHSRRTYYSLPLYVRVHVMRRK